MTNSAIQRSSRLISDQVIDGIIVFFEEFFENVPGFTFSADETLTEILIHDFDSLNLETVDQRSRIAVELMDTAWEQNIVDKLQRLNIEDGVESYTEIARSNITIHCVSKESLEAKKLASIVFESVMAYRPEIRKIGNYFDIETTQMGREQRVRSTSDAEVRVVPVMVRILTKRTYVRVLQR